MRVRRWIVLGLVAAAVAGGGYFASKKGLFHLKKGDAPAEVRLEPVSRGDLGEIVSAPGQSEPFTLVSISAKIAARIVELPFKEGDRVRKGDPLLKLDASDLAANLKATEARYEAQKASLAVAEARIKSRVADLEASKVMLDDARRDLRRQAGLLETNDVAGATVESAQVKVDQLKSQYAGAEQSLAADTLDLSVLKFNLEAASAEISQARETLSYAVINSPIDGTITRLNAKVGELVVTGTMNNAGTVILEVADLARMLVVARVDEASIANVKVGQRAVCRSTAYSGREFGGVVQSVALSKTSAAQASQQGQSSDGIPYFKTEILLDPGGEILSGVSADVEIETMLHRNVVKVPSQAVLGRSVDELPPGLADLSIVDRSRLIATVVFVFENGRAVVRPVKIGSSDLTHTIIESGLNEGEKVIVGPYKSLEGLKHDAEVKLQAAAATKPSAAPAPGGPATRPASRQAATTNAAN